MSEENKTPDEVLKEFLESELGDYSYFKVEVKSEVIEVGDTVIRIKDVAGDFQVGETDIVIGIVGNGLELKEHGATYQLCNFKLIRKAPKPEPKEPTFRDCNPKEEKSYSPVIPEGKECPHYDGKKCLHYQKEKSETPDFQQLKNRLSVQAIDAGLLRELTHLISIVEKMYKKQNER